MKNTLILELEVDMDIGFMEITATTVVGKETKRQFQKQYKNLDGKGFGLDELFTLIKRDLAESMRENPAYDTFGS